MKARFNMESELEVENPETHQHIKRRKSQNALVKYWDLYLIMVPGIVFFIIYRYVPMWGVVIAFQDYSVFGGFSASEWVGWKHFERMFSAPEFYNIFKNTLLISLYKLVWGFPAPIIVALLLNEIRNMLYKRTIQTVIYLPHFLSWVIVGGIMINILQPSTGILNGFLGLFGIDPINFLADKNWFRSVL